MIFQNFLFFKILFFAKFYFFIFLIKMDNMKVTELKAEAKRLGLNNYSRLSKQELIDLLRKQRTPTIEPSEPITKAPEEKRFLRRRKRLKC